MSPRSRGPAGPKPVEAIEHPDKRLNLPTPDARDFVPPDLDDRPPLTYPREIYEPMLVWRDKEALDDVDLVVDVPPIYLQEKIDARALVAGLPRTTRPPDYEQAQLFYDQFDGLSDLDRLEFYQHPAKWANRMILGDSLQVMASLAERERLRKKVQMIYLDPPYGIKFNSNWQVSARKRDVKDGKLEDVAREAEQIRAFRDTWKDGIHSYLGYLRDRLVVARDLLTDSGSIFVQIGDENVHLVRNLLDEVFGADNFVSSIVLKTTSGAGSPSGGTLTLAGVHDYVLWYGRDRAQVKYRQLYAAKGGPGADVGFYRRVRERDGRDRPAVADELANPSQLPPGARLFFPDNLTSQSSPESAQFPVAVDDGPPIRPMKGGWKTNPAGMNRLRAAGRLFTTRDRTLRFVRFLEDFPAMPLNNVWTDVGTGSFTEAKAYIVQTNTKIVQRCILMATDPGDLVLDPTCGSGTTAHVAEQWGRRWITIDTSRVALALARQRLMGARFPYYLLADSAEGRKKESALSATPLPPAEPTGDIHHGFVYERVQHITLKSIANNPDINEGMSREEIDAAIKRHADFELLYDKPYEDKSKVRVSGPFTVESLSPHRSLAFARPGEATDEAASETTAAEDPDAPTFEQTILDNLRIAGIQNGKRSERLTFDVIEPYAGQHIQAVGIREDPPAGSPGRVGIAIGPQYGTVSPDFVRDAAREANKAQDIDLLCLLAFAFEPQVLNDNKDYEASEEGFDVAGERSLGRTRVLLVRMNTDLLMGEDLKKTGAGNLFTVFGEPEIAITRIDEGELVVELVGVDVYDPTSGEVRSDGIDKIALWMIDTNYTGDQFNVGHCYFTGGQDPYARLKAALKDDIDREAWETLNRNVSRPFPLPDTGKIAVKVINDYGDEVVKVIPV